MLPVALASLSTVAAAQDLFVPEPDFEAGTGGYFQPAPIVPPGGCVWENAVFSDGAIIERRRQPWSFFRCMNGSWRSFDSFYAAAAASGQPAIRPSARDSAPRRLDGSRGPGRRGE
jgi:hypothetical protein